MGFHVTFRECIPWQARYLPGLELEEMLRELDVPRPWHAERGWQLRVASNEKVRKLANDK